CDLTTTRITPIARHTTKTCTMNRNISRSERRGFHTELEDVDRRVDDDPHDVDEMTVDPGYLDATVLFGREVPAERADVGEQQQDQAHGHVGAVQAGEA